MKGAPSQDMLIIPGPMDSVMPRSVGDLTLHLKQDLDQTPFVLLDCHDQSLWSSGRLLIEAGGTLYLLCKDGAVLRQKGRADGHFVRDLPDGPVRAALSDFPALRALTAIGRGLFETHALAALDDLQKTQVRGVVMTLVSDAGQVTIVALQNLRGYDRAYSRVIGALGNGAQKLGDDGVFRTLFPNHVTYRAKPDIAMTTDERAFDAACDIIATYLKVARQNEAGIVADIDTEFLHDYRVSLRRIRSVLSLFKGVFSEAQTATLKRAFSDLMAPTGRLRDLDVYTLDRDNYFSMIPEELHVGARQLFDRFESERSQELARLARNLRSRDYNGRMADLTEMFNGDKGVQPGPNAERGACEFACALIWKRYGKLCKLARSITPETPDEAVHELRILCKKLRYLMEFFAPLFDARSFRVVIRPLKKLQDNLGRFNDCSVQQQALMELVQTQTNTAGRIDARLGLAVGGLVAVLNQRQQAERARVIDNFRHFDGPDVRKMFRTLFHEKEG